MESILIKGFENHDKNLIIEGLKAGEDKQIIFDYSKGMEGGKLTMWQGWILQELHKVKNHGYGIFELV